MKETVIDWHTITCFPQVDDVNNIHENKQGQKENMIKGGESAACTDLCLQ